MFEYDTIVRAQAMLNAGPTTTPSAYTIATYKAKSLRLVRLAKELKGDWLSNLIACAKDTESASTWFGRRAALTYTLRNVAENQLAEQDKIHRALTEAELCPDAQEWQQWKRMVRTIGNIVDVLTKLQSEPGPAIAERKPRHSKRKDMRGLPDDWRERLIARLPAYRLPALTQAVTGCRPDELTKGVKLAIVGNYLIAYIKGSKVTAKSGQGWRQLSWPINSASPLVAMLVKEISSGSRTVEIKNAKTYSGAFRAAGRREWPERKKSVTPYCLRHAAASDMKAAGIDGLEISAALGHCVDKTRSYYGQWSQGSRSGGVSPKTIEAERPVRIARPEISRHVLNESSPQPRVL